MVRFKLSELAEWQQLHGSTTSADLASGSEVSDE
jgi:hypothetical protein